MLGFYSVDITIDDDGKPNLIEINGSNSGFDGFLIAYEDMSLQEAISEAFRTFIGDRTVYVVTQLANFGQLPRAFLDKLLQDLLYFKSIESVHATFRKGIIGANWARMRTDRPPSTIGAGTSLDALVQIDPRFKKVMLNVSNPSYVIPLEYFKDDIDRGALSLKNSMPATVDAHGLRDDDVLWLRCANLAFSEPLNRGMLINAEFPYESIADNKWFTYDILSGAFPANDPPSLPVGNRCSGSQAVRELLDRCAMPLFIRKPLLGSQARGIEVIRRQDVEEYAHRLERLEQASAESGSLPLELQGVPELLATWALRFDVSLLSELRLSRPVYCRRTRRLHYGCMRTILLLRENDDKSMDVRFLGAYWRLARVPIDGDGLLWERFIGSQSQGAFCEPAPAADLAVAEPFAVRVVQEFCRRVAGLPAGRDSYRQWETNYWLARYRRQASVLQDDRTWRTFLQEIASAAEEGMRTKQAAAAAGFLHDPSTVLTRAQSISARFPYLVKEPQRIAVR